MIAVLRLDPGARVGHLPAQAAQLAQDSLVESQGDHITNRHHPKQPSGAERMGRGRAVVDPGGGDADSALDGGTAAFQAHPRLTQHLT